MPLNVVLMQPEIPQNTGNISRTCVVTGSSLHIVKPMGFSLGERYLRRAGLDYWKYLNLSVHENTGDFFRYAGEKECWFFSSKAGIPFSEARFSEDCFLVFGNETKGLPAEMLKAHGEHCLRIPMVGGQRCLNLSNAVCVAVYEALRQHGYRGLI